MAHDGVLKVFSGALADVLANQPPVPDLEVEID